MNKARYVANLESIFSGMLVLEKYIENESSHLVSESKMRDFILRMNEFQVNLKLLLEQVSIEKEIQDGINKYEPLLKLRYQEKVLKGVSIEVIIELMCSEYVLIANRDIEQSFEDFYNFYKENKKELGLIVEGSKDCVE